MKSLLLTALVAFALCLCVSASVNSFGKKFIHSDTAQFIAFQKQFSKVYASQEEFNTRLNIFSNNLKRVNQLNAANPDAVFGITKFMDLSPSEFKNTILMTRMPPLPEYQPYHNETFVNAIPTKFDWRDTKGVVTPVYNQGQCGSCWAFSATENLESRWALDKHPLTSLSMQQVVSCDTTCYGCEGGWPYAAFEYLHQVGGQDTYESYPYTASDGKCEFSKDHIDARVKSWEYVTKTKNEEEMANYMVAHGPLSVCVDAEPWQYYVRGILDADKCGDSIDHCVEMIGYDRAGSSPYWIVRNSWGADWGVAGYIYLQYGHDTCAVAQVVTSSLPQ